MIRSKQWQYLTIFSSWLWHKNLVVIKSFVKIQLPDHCYWYNFFWKHRIIGNLLPILLHLIKRPWKSQWQKIIHISNAILFISVACSYETGKMFPYFFSEKIKLSRNYLHSLVVIFQLVNYEKSAITLCLKSKNCFCLLELFSKKT